VKLTSKSSLSGQKKRRETASLLQDNTQVTISAEQSMLETPHLFATFVVKDLTH
jgi:hypothetical protein